jgi:hypothetical protein
MGYIKEPSGIDFVVESKNWSDAEILEMRNIIAKSKKQTTQRRSAVQKTHAFQQAL